MDSRVRALLDFAVQLTRGPEKASAEMLESLRKAGWTDSQIHDAVQVIAAFNYYTRLAHGLGVEPEDFMPQR